MSGILIDVNARTSKSEQDLARINQSIRNIEKSTNSASKALSSAFIGIGGALLSAGTFSALKNISSEFTNLENKIALVTGRTNQLIVTQTKLFKIAEETRSSLSGTVSIFSSFGKSLKDIGASSDNILKATKTVQQSIAISGSSAESAAAALIQLGQGLSSGVLRGEELNSVLEQAPRLAKAIADELNVTTGQLRKLGADGQLVSETVFKALLNQSQKINKEFETLSPTLQQASNVLLDSVKIYINELDKGLGISSKIGIFIFNLAKSIKNSAESAFELGNNLQIAFIKSKSTFLSIASPILKSIQEIGKQFLKIVPGIGLTRTLVGDVREAIRIIDKELLGNLITKFNQFKFVDLITIESDVEKAIRTLKRLSPSYWAASGFDVKTFRQVFSTENIRLYGEAFSQLAEALKNNTQGLSATFIDFARKLDFGFKALSRYFGFRVDTIIAFSRGQLDTFFVTLTEIIRGITGVRIKFFEFRKIFTDILQPGFEAFSLAVTDIFKNLPKAFINFVKTIAVYSKDLINVISQITKELLFVEFNLNYKEVLDTTLDIISAFVKRVFKLLDFRSSLDKLKDFGSQVIEVFKEVYDKVIGNSWWTDTIENIISTSNKLWQNASKGLNKFKTNSIKIFQDIFSNKISFDFNFKNKLNFSNIFEKVNSKTVMESFKNIYENSITIFKDLFSTFPALVKTSLIGIASTIVYYLFPASLIKTTLLTAILSSFVTNASLIAEKFGLVLTGESLASKLGTALGTAIGYFVRDFIKEIPLILNAFGSFVSSAFRGFVEQLPIIGSFISSLFSLSSKIGIAGPVGVIGAYLLGKNLNLLQVLSKIEPLNAILTMFNLNFEEGKDSIKSNAVIGRIFSYLFGNIGKERTIAGMLGVLDLLGAFESIFAGSPLAQLGARAGVLYTFIYGKEGINNIKEGFLKFVAKPIGDLLRNFAQSKGGATNTIYDILFGDAGTLPQRASLVLKPLLDKITNSIIDFAAPKAKKGFDFLLKFFLGDDPKSSIIKIKDQFKNVIQTFLSSLKKVANPVITPIIQAVDAKRYEAWLKKNASGPTKQPSWIMGGQEGFIEKQLNNIKKIFEKFTKDTVNTANRVAGETGLLGRLFLGKYSKQFIIGSILAIFSAFALANVQTSKEIVSPFDTLIEELKGINLTESFLSTFTPLVAVGLAAALAGLLLFKRNIVTIFSEIKAKGINTFSTIARSAGASNIADVVAGTGSRRSRGSGAAAATTIVAGGAVGAAVGYSTESIINGIIAGVSVASIVQSLSPKLIAGFLKLIKSAVFTAIKFLFRPAVLVARIGVTLVGAAAIWLFGPNQNFFKDLELAKDKVREFFGLAPKEKPSERGLSSADEKFLTRNKITSEFSLSGINIKKLSDVDTEKLKKRTEEYTKAIEKAREEEEKNLKVSPETLKDLELLDKGLQNFTTKLAVKSNSSEQSLSKFIKSLEVAGPTSKFGDFIRLKLQEFNDISFNLLKGATKLNRFFATTPEARTAATNRLSQLEASRPTRFNALFRPLSDAEKQLFELAKSAEGVSITNEDLELSLSKARAAYEEEAKRIQRKQTTIFGGTRELPLGETANLTILRAIAADLLQQKVAFDRVGKSALSYRKELQNISETFKDFDINIDFSGIFAADQFDLNQLKLFQNQLKKLKVQIEDTSNVANQNEIVIRVTEIKRQILEVVEKSQLEVSPIRPQVQAKTIAEAVGIPLSKEISDNLSDSAAVALRDLLFKYQKDLEKSQRRTIPEMPIYGGVDKLIPRERLPVIPGEDLQVANKNLENLRKSIGNLISDVTRGGRGELANLQQTAERLSVNFENLVTKFGINRSIALLSNLDNKLRELEEAKATREDTRVVRLLKETSILREELNKLPIDFQAALGYLNMSNNAITAEDLFNTKDILKEALSVSNSMRLIEDSFKLLGTNVSQEKLDEIFKKKLDASKKQFELFLKTIANTPVKLLQILERTVGNIGIESNIPSEALISISTEIEVVRLKLEELFKTTKTPADFRFVLSLRKQLEKLTTYIREEFSTNFESTFNKVNTSLELNIPIADYSRLPQELTESLSKYADFVQKNLEKIRKTGLTISNETPKAFFDRFDELSRKTGFVKFFSDFSKSFSKISFEGFALQFNRLKELLPNLNLDQTDFLKLPSSFRKEVAEQATILTNLKEVVERFGGSLSEEQFSLFQNLDDTNLKEIFAKFQKSIFDDLSNIPPEIKQEIDKILKIDTDPTRQLNSTLLTTNQELINLKEALQNLSSKALGIPLSSDKESPSKTPIINQANNTPIQTPILPLIRGINTNTDASPSAINAINNAILNISNKTISSLPTDLATKVKAKELKLDFDEMRFKALEPSAQKTFEDLVNKAYTAQTKALQEKTAISIQSAEEALEEVEYFISTRFTKYINKTRAAGLAFSSQISETISSAFSDMLKGKADENKSIFRTFSDKIVDTFTNAIIDAFIKGLTDPLLANTKIFEDIGKSVFEIGKNILKGVFTTKDKPGEGSSEKPADTATGFIASFVNAFKSIKFSDLFKPFISAFESIDFKSLFSFVSKGISSLIKFLPFAEGGFVRGPGSGTSDSIPAMLSNGEFVVNAKATKDNFRLLSAINSGSFRKFAEGGLVSTAIVATPALANLDNKTQSKSTQQVFNISITGDISRQTKAEIYQMLPTIAEGVNLHNREKGYR